MKRFKKIYIEITNVCNLSCSFCAKTKREPKFMTIKEFSYILNEVKPFTDYIYLHLMGEPFLHPQFKELLELCRIHNIKVNITTNGTRINQVKDILLNAPALRKIAFSIHSFEANDSNQSLACYLGEICSFIKESDSTKIIRELRLWNGDSKSKEGKNLLNDAVLEHLEHNLNVIMPDSEHRNGSMKLGERLFLGFAEIFDWPDEEQSDLDPSIFCYGLRDHIGILADGTVVPCCLDHEGTICLGNLFSSSLSQILNSSRAKKIYDGFSRRQAVESLCSRCRYARKF